jgi:tripartite tricarboxylate transporter TctB family protein
MSTDTKLRGYWREEFSLIAILLLFFIGIVVLCYHIPFDARLFPLVIGSAGILLTLAIAIEQLRRRGGRDASMLDEDDPAAKAGWPRYATALLAAPAFGLLFWLVGFIVASLAAMLLMPVLMGYANRRRLVVIALTTVAILALVGPQLLNVDLPHGLVGDWLIDKLALRAG